MASGTSSRAVVHSIHPPFSVFQETVTYQNPGDTVSGWSKLNGRSEGVRVVQRRTAENAFGAQPRHSLPPVSAGHLTGEATLPFPL